MPVDDHISSLIKGVAAGTAIGSILQGMTEQFMYANSHPDAGLFEGWDASLRSGQHSMFIAAAAYLAYAAVNKMPGWKPNTFLAAAVPSMLGAAFSLAVTATPAPAPVERLAPVMLPAEPAAVEPR